MGNNDYKKVFINVKKPTRSGSGAQTYVGRKKKPTKFFDPYRIVDFIKKALD
tara:strand:+ start:914 stop:1069 length:156 start_codon:yes stop_codon:yes gene_type:complete